MNSTEWMSAQPIQLLTGWLVRCSFPGIPQSKCTITEHCSRLIWWLYFLLVGLMGCYDIMCQQMEAERERHHPWVAASCYVAAMCVPCNIYGTLAGSAFVYHVRSMCKNYWPTFHYEKWKTSIEHRTQNIEHREGFLLASLLVLLLPTSHASYLPKHGTQLTHIEFLRSSSSQALTTIW